MVKLKLSGKMCLQLVDMRCTSENKQSALEMVHNGEGSFFKFTIRY